MVAIVLGTRRGQLALGALEYSRSARSFNLAVQGAQLYVRMLFALGCKYADVSSQSSVDHGNWLW